MPTSLTLDATPVGGARHTYFPSAPKVPGNFGTGHVVWLTTSETGRLDMHRRRWLWCTLAFAWAFVLMPAEASADGGAYIDLDRTHLLVGSIGHAETYVAVPAGKQDLFGRGPFYLYVTPARSPVTRDQPLPNGAVRVATMAIERGRGTSFELSASFTVPDLPGDFYALGVCNDPCTISGFREPLTGTISIVQTAREAELLNERQHLVGETYGLKKQIRKLERANDDLSNRLQGSSLRQAELSVEVGRLRNTLADGRAEQPRAGSSSWFLLALAIAVGLALLVRVVLRRRIDDGTRVATSKALRG